MEVLRALQRAGEFGPAMTQSQLLEEEGVLRVGGQSFALDAATAAQRTAGMRKGEPYRVRDVYVALLQANAPIREYAAYCQEHQASRLMEPERKELLRFVLGELGSENESALLGRALQAREDAMPEEAREKDAVVGVERAATAAGREDAVGGRPMERAPEEAAAAVEQRVRAAMKRERVQRSMDSVLEVDARRRVDFSKLAVMERLRAVLEDMRSGKARRAGASAERPAARAPTEAVDIVRGDRYKADTQRAYREAGLGDVERLQIDPAASFSAAEAWSTSATPSAAPTAVTADVRPNAAIPMPRPAAVSGAETPRPPAPIDGEPIIILPSGVQPLLTMLNAASFLERGVFASHAEMRQRGSVKRPGERLRLHHRGETYVVTDQPNRLTADEWRRVVAVICQGAAWQFKGWPFPGGPSEIFARKRGFYFHYDDERIPSQVSQWAVKCIAVSRNRRHMDESAALEFWSAVHTHRQRMRHERGM